MARFVLQFPAEEIAGLAGRFGYEADARRLAVGAAARARRHYTRAEVLEVCRWKTPRSAPEVAANDEAAVGAAAARALAAADEEARIGARLGFQGGGVP